MSNTQIIQKADPNNPNVPWVFLCTELDIGDILGDTGDEDAEDI